MAQYKVTDLERAQGIKMFQFTNDDIYQVKYNINTKLWQMYKNGVPDGPVAQNFTPSDARKAIKAKKEKDAEVKAAKEKAKATKANEKKFLNEDQAKKRKEHIIKNITKVGIPAEKIEGICKEVDNVIDSHLYGEGSIYKRMKVDPVKSIIDNAVKEVRNENIKGALQTELGMDSAAITDEIITQVGKLIKDDVQNKGRISEAIKENREEISKIAGISKTVTPTKEKDKAPTTPTTPAATPETPAKKDKAPATPATPAATPETPAKKDKAPTAAPTIKAIDINRISKINSAINKKVKGLSTIPKEDREIAKALISESVLETITNPKSWVNDNLTDDVIKTAIDGATNRYIQKKESNQKKAQKQSENRKKFRLFRRSKEKTKEAKKSEITDKTKTEVAPAKTEVAPAKTEVAPAEKEVAPTETVRKPTRVERSLDSRAEKLVAAAKKLDDADTKKVIVAEEEAAYKNSAKKFARLLAIAKKKQIDISSPQRSVNVSDAMKKIQERNAKQVTFNTEEFNEKSAAISNNIEEQQKLQDSMAEDVKKVGISQVYQDRKDEEIKAKKAIEDSRKAFFGSNITKEKNVKRIQTAMKSLNDTMQKWKNNEDTIYLSKKSINNAAKEYLDAIKNDMKQIIGNANTKAVWAQINTRNLNFLGGTQLPQLETLVQLQKAMQDRVDELGKERSK